MSSVPRCLRGFIESPTALQVLSPTYDGLDVTPFIYTLLCVKQENLYRTTLNLTYMLTYEETRVKLPLISHTRSCVKKVV